MRKINSLLLALIILSSCNSDPDYNSGKEKLTGLLKSYYDALTKKDMNALKSVTATNFVSYDNGIIYNTESAAKSVEGMPPFTATFAFDSININVGKINASAYYLRQAVFTIQDSTYPPMRFLESATFEKEKGEWKIRFIQSTIRK